MKLSERIKQFRKENNLTQDSLSKMLFVSKQAVSKWENDRGMPDVSLYPELAKILNIKKGGIFAIGDYYNDVEMLQFADISGTTAQAPNDIKKLVNFVGGPCNKGAVADFIEYLKTEVQK